MQEHKYHQLVKVTVSMEMSDTTFIKNDLV